ncbi:uncharacterized protein LOC101239564 [Hydra vulgaris]|uniref:uncharacterized protein LOC101239564 n=1 Tax=Hydra vulgaris TaxID=6087 RepID=UPI0002B44FFD|nr:uncharacterized protein LOC101239564 [Hydra vulgaris]
MSIKSAAKKYNVPHSSLQTKLSCLSNLMCRPGPAPTLPLFIEDACEKYLIEMARRGFLLKINEFLIIVLEIMHKSLHPAVFKNEIPSRTWAYSYLNRHPELKSKTSEHHSLGWSSFTKESLLAFYRNFEKFIEDQELKHVIQSPERVFNLDKTAFYLNSNKGKFIGRKHECLQQVCTTSEKENVTVAINFSAAGEMAPPMVVLKKQKLSKNLQQCAPLGMLFQKSSSGWTKRETFLYYLKEFKRYLVGKDLLNMKDNNQKVLLLVDRHSSHLSYGASKYCEDTGIVLYCLYPGIVRYCLYPNATHV